MALPPTELAAEGSQALRDYHELKNTLRLFRHGSIQYLFVEHILPSLICMQYELPRERCSRHHVVMATTGSAPQAEDLFCRKEIGLGLRQLAPPPQGHVFDRPAGLTVHVLHYTLHPRCPRRPEPPARAVALSIQGCVAAAPSQRQRGPSRSCRCMGRSKSLGHDSKALASEQTKRVGSQIQACSLLTFRC
jgi:hypothetical protein